MKLQTAIDRVNLSQAEELVKLFAGKTDIIELGTSLVKDYGLFALKKLNQYKKDSLLLVDIKTYDEGAYEFCQGYEQEFDILTVMGSSSIETLEKCYEISEKYQKYMLIDLLECPIEKIEKIKYFKNAIYCMHTSVDKGENKNIIQDIQWFRKRFPEIQKLCVAGGITLDVCKEMKNSKIKLDSVIIGSAITKADNMEDEMRKFKEALR